MVISFVLNVPGVMDAGKAEEIKLLYHFSGIAGIFFPIGKLEDDGTCEFHTTKCLLVCAAINCDSAEKEIIGHELKKVTHDFIVEEDIFKVLHKITEELKDMKSNILYWFASGDCERKHIGKIIKIIKYLAEEGIVQCGFTRNKELWEKIGHYANIALTLESFVEVRKTQSAGLFAIPDYKTTKVKIYRGTFHSGTCGMSFFTYKNIKRKANCVECYKQSQGCFYEKYG